MWENRNAAHEIMLGFFLSTVRKERAQTFLIYSHTHICPWWTQKAHQFQSGSRWVYLQLTKNCWRMQCCPGGVCTVRVVVCLEKSKGENGSMPKYSVCMWVRCAGKQTDMFGVCAFLILQPWFVDIYLVCVCNPAKKRHELANWNLYNGLSDISILYVACFGVRVHVWPIFMCCRIPLRKVSSPETSTALFLHTTTSRTRTEMGRILCTRFARWHLTVGSLSFWLSLLNAIREQNAVLNTYCRE